MSNPFDILEARLATIENLLLDIKHPRAEPIQHSLSSDKDQNFTIPQLAEYLNCHIQTVMKQKREGLLPFYQTGRKIFFKKLEIDRLTSVPTSRCKRK